MTVLKPFEIMENIVDFSQNTEFSGLGTVTFVPAADGNYKMEGKISLPSPSQGGGESSVIVTINKNGSPVLVGPAAAKGFKSVQALLTSDTITIVLSSGAAADQPKNAVKSSISISAGE